jgi:general secretion pathway protein E
MHMQLIGQILLNRGLVTKQDLSQALRLQEETSGLLGQAFLRIGALTEDALLEALCAQLDLPILDAKDAPTVPELHGDAMRVLKISPRWFLAHSAAVWISEENDQQILNVVAREILNPEIQENIEGHWFRLRAEQESSKGKDKPLGPIRYWLSSNQFIERCLYFINESLGSTSSDMDDLHDTARLKEMAEEAPVIDFVNNVFATALKNNASDIHIEPFEHEFKVRYRIDGVLHTRQSEPRGIFDAVTSRVKLLSGMDIAERRLPQDGRQSIRFAGHAIDLRVSSLPGSWGESMVLRLLKKEGELPDMQGLGLTGRANTVMHKLTQNSNGVILVTGPTGSGKSTTLYRCLQQLNNGITKIISIEDPVEYDMEGVVQIQTKADIGYTFAKGLRAILRQDPDIIMVGEIRDGETATIAAQAALTGHLVLSTVHTNSSLAAIARLVDLGLEPYMIAAAVRGLAAQRLVRRLCPDCSVPDTDGEGEAMLERLVRSGLVLQQELEGKTNWRKSVGCEACANTGYSGRIAVFEVVAINDEMRDAILENAHMSTLLDVARKQGFQTLLEDGLLKARQGTTTLGEVLRVCGAEQRQPEKA